jgi:nitrile hydratase
MTDVHSHHHPRAVSAVELRARALEALLAERGLVSTDSIDAVVELYERDVGPQNGAKVVARAWVDEHYRERLLNSANDAISELGFGGAEGDNMVVVANAPAVHNMITRSWGCTRP